MAEGGEVEKTYLCGACQHMRPRSQYSSKQFKKKGKRKCSTCLDSEDGMVTTEKKDPYMSFLKTKDEGKTTVKAVKADAVKRAQDRLGKGDSSSPDTDKFDVLLNWLKAGGAKHPHLVLKYYTVDYRGVHSKTRLEADQCILEVPLPLIMTSDVAKASKVGTAISSSGCQLRSSHSWLASYLLQEKHNPKSYWKPYIDILPVHYRNMPIFFDEEELSYLKGSFSLQMIEDRKVSLKMEYDNICRCVPSFKDYGHIDFVWARLAVITRIFGFEVNGKKTDGLVPMADMLNHKRPNETTWTYDGSVKGFTITTTKRLLRGAQIFDSYGRKCNSRYFVNYGFSLEDNEDNQVAMWFNLPDLKIDFLHSVKVKLLGARTRRFQIPFDHQERVAQECLSYLRIALANEEELTVLTSDPKFNARKVPKPVSRRNELACVREIARQAKIVYDKFETTLEEDIEMLEDPDKKLTMNIRNCILMRRGEKQVLLAYMDLAKKLDGIEDYNFKDFKKYFIRVFKDRGRAPSFEYRTEKYVNEIIRPLFSGESVEVHTTDNSHNAD